MSNSLVNAVSQFIQGIIGIIMSIFNSIFAVVQAIFALFAGALNVVLDVVKQVGVMGFRMSEGVVGFVVDNFVAIAVVAAAGYAYSVYGRGNGRGRVKTN